MIPHENNNKDLKYGQTLAFVMLELSCTYKSDYSRCFLVASTTDDEQYILEHCRNPFLVPSIKAF